MIHESYPWKMELKKYKKLFLKYNKAEYLKNYNEKAYASLEMSIFYSAFIIRKLIDCVSKVSDDVDRYVLHVNSIKPLRTIDRLHNTPSNENFDWVNKANVTIKGKDLCNWLIHSYIFCFEMDENEEIDGFIVCSDYDRNKQIFLIDIEKWFDYVDFVASDRVTSIKSVFRPKNGDYEFLVKKRQTQADVERMRKNVQDLFFD